MFSSEDRTASTTTDSDPCNLSQHSPTSKLLPSSPLQPVSSPHLSQSEGSGLHFWTQADETFQLHLAPWPAVMHATNKHLQGSWPTSCCSLVKGCMLFIRSINHQPTSCLSSVKLKTSICAQYISIKTTTYCEHLWIILWYFEDFYQTLIKHNKMVTAWLCDSSDAHRHNKQNQKHVC